MVQRTWNFPERRVAPEVLKNKLQGLAASLNASKPKKGGRFYRRVGARRETARE